MLKLFDTPSQLIGNAIAFIVLGLIFSWAAEKWAGDYYQITVVATNLPIIWAYYKLMWAPQRDSRPMTRLAMFLVGTSLIGMYASLIEVFP